MLVVAAVLGGPHLGSSEWAYRAVDSALSSVRRAAAMNPALREVLERYLVTTQWALVSTDIQRDAPESLARIMARRRACEEALAVDVVSR